MPELPEVEVVRQSLSKKIKQKKVKKVIVRNRNLRIKIPLNFANFLENLKIIKVKRFSKYLIFCLSNNSFFFDTFRYVRYFTFDTQRPKELFNQH